MRCSAMSSAFTGLNVPMPTCSVTRTISIPRAAMRIEDLLREVQARRRRGDRASRGGVDGLIRLAVAVARLLARDVRRQRRDAEALDLARCRRGSG